MIDNNTFGYMNRAIRLNFNVTLKQQSEMAEVPMADLHRIENGLAEPTAEQKQNIHAYWLGVLFAQVMQDGGATGKEIAEVLEAFREAAA